MRPLPESPRLGSSSSSASAAACGATAAAKASRKLHHPAIRRGLPALRSLPAWVVLAALVAASTLLRAWAGLRVPTPWINADEIVYAELGRSLYESARLEILGRPTHFYSLVYPALVGLPLSLADLERGYALLKGLQALVMSLTAVPVYLWGRSLMAQGWALTAAALSLAIPGLAYSGLIMTEVVFYPVIVLAAWAMARALARPTLGNQALMLAVIALAVATRLQALVLVPVFLTALVLKLALDRRKARDAFRFAPALGGLALLAAGWSVWRLWGGGPAGQLFGAYRAAAEVSYSLEDAVRFVIYHAADALLLTGIVPVCAVALLLVGALSTSESSEAVRAYLAVTAALLFWLVVEVGVFASRHVGRLAERDLLALAPVLFLGFALWLDRGAPRPRAPRVLVALAALLLLLSLPMKKLVSHAAIPDAFTLIPLYELQVERPGANLDLVVLDVAAPLLVLFALLPRRLLWLLPLSVFVLLGGASLSASRVVTAQATTIRPQLLGEENRWIDRAAAGPVVYLYAGEANWNAVYENVFWNRRIERIYDLSAFQVPGPLPQRPVGPEADGRIVFADGQEAPARYVVASSSITFFGTQVTEARGAQLALWRLDRPFRLSTWLTGMGVFTSAGDSHANLAATGDIASRAKLVVYACAGGELRLTLVVPEATAIELRRDGRIVRRLALGPWESWSGVIAARRREPDGVAGQCEFQVSSDSRLAVHVTRLEFVRARDA